jgi:hypothetical protein
LYISEDNQTTWEYKGSSIVTGNPGVPTQGTCYKEIHDFTCGDKDVDSSNWKWFKWRIENGEPQNAWNTTPIQGPNLTESSVDVILIEGNDYVFNRTNGNNQIRRLAVNVYDTENNSYANNTNVSFWITNDLSTYRLENINTTDVLGNSSYWFDPNCTHSVGMQYWIAGVTDSCYVDTNTSTNFTLNITGNLKFNITSPVNDTVAGTKYLRGEDDIVFRGNISDECGLDISNAVINFTAVQNSEEHMCSSVNNEGNGFYNCTVLGSSTSSWTSSNTTAPYGYSVKFNATADDYNYNSTIDVCSPATILLGCTDTQRGFLLETRPNLTAPSVQSSGDGGWGETWTFRVNASDADWDNSKVQLWIRYCADSDCTSFNPDWKSVTCSSPTGCINYTVTGVNTTVTFLLIGKDNIDSDKLANKWQYKFNMTDYVSGQPSYPIDEWDFNESAVNNFTVTQDDINITYVYGNNSVVNRSIAPDQSNATLSVIIYDTDTGIALGSGKDGGKLYVTYNTSDTTKFILDQIKSTGANGYLNFTFMNSSNRCSYDIGPLKWKIGFGGGAYKEVNSTTWYNSFNVNTTTYPLQVNVIGPDNKTYRRNVDSTPYIGNVTDDCSATTGTGVKGASITFQGYYDVTNPSWALCQSVTDNNNGTYNCSKLSTGSADFNNYNLTMNATKQYYNSSITSNKINSFWIVSNPEMWGEVTNISGDAAGWGETWKFSVYVRDLDASDFASFEAMNVSLWFNLTGQWQLANSSLCTNCFSGNDIIEFVNTFTCGNIGNKQYKFNVSDYWNYTNTTNSHGFTIQKDDVTVYQDDSIDPDSIDRESGSGLFIFRMNDTDANTYVTNTSTNASIYFGYERDVTEYNISYSVNPNSTGYVNKSLDPDCNYSAGKHYWTASVISGDSCYQQSSNMSALSFDVVGQLKNNLTMPVYDSNHNVTEQIPINFTTLSDCSVYRSDENPVINASDYKIELSLYGIQWQLCSSENSYQGWYNCTWNSTNKTEGQWDVRVNSSLTNFSDNSTTYVDWFNLLNWNVTNESVPNVLPSEGGWTRLYNYTIDVYDQEGDTINCSLYISKDNETTWEYKGSSIVSGNPGTPTSGTCYKEIHDFTCGDKDVDSSNWKWFKWRIENGEPQNAWNTTLVQGPNLTESSVSVILIEGNDYVFNRTLGLNQVRRLAINVYDTENNSYANNTNVSFWITNDTSTYRLENINQTNTLGNSSYYFDPNCSHTVGMQYWIAGVTDSCYVDTNTSTNFTLNITGDLKFNITSPVNDTVAGTKYLRGERDIIFRGNVTDECGLDIDTATINFTAVQQGEEHMCSSVFNEGGGWYNCTVLGSSTSSWTPSNTSAPYGYSVKFNATADDYNYNSTTDVCSPADSGFGCTGSSRGFLLETRPNLTAPSVSSSGDGGWGETWTFKVNASDADWDNLKVRLYIRYCTDDSCTSFDPDWKTVSSCTPSNCINYSVTGVNTTITFIVNGENEIGSSKIGKWQYKFSTSDYPEYDSWDTNESAVNNFTVTQDDINITYVWGNNSLVNRSIAPDQSNATLSVIIYDTDRNSALGSGVSGGKLYATYNTSDTTKFILDQIKSTAANGYLNFTFMNSSNRCSYDIGPLKWKVGFGGGAYKEVNSTTWYNSFNVNTTTYPLQVNVIGPNNKTYRRNVDPIPYVGNVTDDCSATLGTGVKGASITFFAERDGWSGWSLCSGGSVTDNNNGTYNCTMNSPSGAWFDRYNLTMNATKQYYNNSITEEKEDSFWIVSNPQIWGEDTNKGGDIGGWGETWDFYVTVKDPDASDFASFEAMNVSLWFNLSGQWQLANSSLCTKCFGDNIIHFLHNFSCGNIGNKQYKFNVSDYWNYNNTTSSNGFTIDKNDVTVSSDDSIDPDSIDREGTDSGLFIFRIYDIDTSSYVTNISTNSSIYFTHDGSGSEYAIGYKVNPNSTGYVNKSLDPDCNYSAGTQKWTASVINADSCYQQAANMSSLTYDIIGQLKNYIIQPTGGSNFAVGEIVNITSNITSDCLENISNAIVTHEARLSPSGTWEWANTTEIINEEFGKYNSSWNTSFHQGGNWSFRINASKSNYYSNSTIFTNWTYLNNTPPTAENVSVSPEIDGWGSNFSFSIDINDAQFDNITCKLFTYTSGSWVYRGSDSVDSGVGSCTVNVTNFTCSDINTTSPNWFKWEINDTTNVFNTSNVSAPYITKDSVTIEYVYGNNSTAQRSGNQKDLLILKIFDNNSQKYVGLEIPNATGRTFVTVNGTDFDLGTENTTNSSGYLNIYFDAGNVPGSSVHDVGLQNWTGGTYDDSCYYDTNLTEKYVLNVVGDLENNINLWISPNAKGGDVIRPDNVTFQMHVWDDEFNDIENVTLNVTFINYLYGKNFTCDNIMEIGGGYYSCTINTTLINAGLYNITVKSNKTYYNNGYFFDSNVFYLETVPELTTPLIFSRNGSDTGGWGETWTAMTNVTDEDQDNVTLKVQVKKYTDPETSWLDENQSSYSTNPDLIEPINQSINLTFFDDVNFKDNQVVWQVRFMVNDTDGYGFVSPYTNFTIEENDVLIELIAGNGEQVWRNGTEVLYLILNVTDLDQNAPAEGANVTFYITTNSSDPNSFDSGSLYFVNSSGISEYPFQPECTDYSVGNQTWYAEINPDIYYKYNKTQNYSLIIKTFIALEINYPSGQSFLLGSQIPFVGRVFDECFNISGAEVKFWDRRAGPTERFVECTGVNDLGNGTYNCSFSSVGPYGWHGTKLEARKQYYGDYPNWNSTLVYVDGSLTHHISSSPSISLGSLYGPSVSPKVDGWGKIRTFEAKITDIDGSLNYIKLWKSFDNVTWYLINETTMSPGGPDQRVVHNVSGEPLKYRFTCEDLFNATNGIIYFKFNTTDIFGYSDESEIDNLTVEVDNVTVTLNTIYSNSTVRRIGNNLAYLRFSIRDDDYGNYYPSNVNGSVWITLNGTNYSYNITNISYSGNLTVHYNATCSSDVGIQYWKGGTIDSCYEMKNTSNATLTVYGQLNVSVINPTNGSIVNRDKNISFNASIKDECGQNISSATVNWYNSSSHLLGTGYNATWYVPIDYKLGPETIITNATKTYYDYNSNNTTVYVYGWSDVSYISPLNETRYASGDDVDIACRVTDSNTTQPIANYTIFIYNNSESLENKTTDAYGFINTTWITAGVSAGWYNITCSIENNSTLYYNTSFSQNETWIMIERPLVINQVRMDGSVCQEGYVCNWIYRNDTFNPHEINISVHVNDANIGSAEGANVTFYNSTSFLGNCTTNSSGWCYLLNYNPSDNINPTVTTIYINATRSQNEDSDTNTSLLRVKGILNTTIISPPDTINCGSGYDCSKSEAINLTVNVISENGENASTLNPTVTWYNETSQVTTGGVSITLPSTKVAEQDTGNHNFMAIVSKSNYDDGTANVTFNISGIVGVYWISPTGIVSYPDTFYPTCFVRDEDSLQGVDEYLVNFSYKWEPSSNFIFNGTYLTNSSGYANYSFIPSQKGNITFNCTVGNNASRYYSTTPPYDVDVETFWVKDIIPPQFYNVSIVPNESIEANLNYTNITVGVNDNYEIKNVWVYIEYPNTTKENKTMTNLTPIQSGFGYYNATYNLTFIPPIGGIFNITIYARDQDPENNVNNTSTYNISVWGEINGSVSQCVNNTNDGDLTDCDSEITAPFITQTDSFTFEIKSNFTNLGPAGAYEINLTHVEIPSGSLTYSDQYHTCSVVYPNETCSWNFNVTVPIKTPPGLYSTYVNATWRNPDNTYQSVNNVTFISVDSNPVINISETQLVKNVTHNQTTYIGNITVVSAGNDEVRNINLTWYGISGIIGSKNLALDCPFCSIYIIPNQETVLFAGNNFTSHINISVPAGQAPGNYLANIIAITENAGNDTALLNLSIPLNDSWIRTPSTFGNILAPLNTSGLIGYINITNIGNIKIGLEVIKSGDLQGYTKIDGQNWFSFDLEKLVKRDLNVTYSIPASASIGVYDITIYIRNFSLTEENRNRNVTISLNVTDIPPNITDVQIVPILFEQGYENVTIQANVTDNFAVDKVWANITPPNGTSFILWMQNYNDYIYNITYVYPEAGTHEIKICANDTASLEACTSPTNVTSSDTTQLMITPNATLLNATEITIESGQSFAINFSVNNVGGSRANNTNVSISYPTNITVSPNYFELGQILKNNSKYNLTTITVVNSTMPGIFVVNLTVNWTNLNNTINSSTFNITMNVIANAEIDIVENNIYKVIYGGDSDNATITLRSIGNDNATNISISCSSGEVCNNFTVDFDPQNISLMPIGNISYVNITFTIPSIYPTGVHSGFIKAEWYDNNFTQNSSAEIPVDILVPANVSWTQSPTESYKRVYNNETGSFEQINLTNTGNANITLNLTVNGTVAPYLTLSEYNLTLAYGETKIIYVNYSSPNIVYNTNYTGYIISNITGDLRENSTIKEISTFVSLFVTPYDVNITYPTQNNSIIGINPWDTIRAKVNVTENGTILSSGVLFEVTVFNSTISNSTTITSSIFNNSENLWFVNFTAPNFSIGRIYNLNITANHTGIYNNTRSDVEYDSIVYNDTIAPAIDVILPTRTPANQTVNIKINVTEAGGLKNITGNITYPNSSTETLNLTYLSKYLDVYTYENNFSKTSQIGNYILSIRACDLSSNCNSTSSSFEIYPTVYFSGYAKNVELLEEPPIYINFTFYDYNTTSVRFSFGTNLTNGYYNETVDVKNYDLEVKTVNQSFRNTIRFSNINISSSYYNPIILGNIPSARTTTSAFKGLYVYSNLSSSDMKIIMDFSECLSLGCGLAIYDPQHLAIYKYNGDWTPKITSSQNSLWTRINNVDGDNADSSVNLTSLSVSATVSSINGAYILAEFICGDDECQTSFGESTNNCPTDCPSLPPTPPTEPTPPSPGGGGGVGAGAGAGAGAGGAGGAAGAITSIPTTPVPLEIKSTLLETTLVPGEEKIFSVDITNNLDSAATATLSVEGPVFALLSIQKPTMSIKAKTTEVSEIKATAPLSAVPGIYTGELVIKSGSIVHRIPVTITVKAVVEPLLDVQVKALSKDVNPGTNLSFEVSLLNMGETAKVEDITVTYSVKPVENQTKIISTSTETLAVDNAITLRKAIEIPGDTPEDKYIIEANASYWYGTKFAISADNFDVTTLPWPLILLKAAFMNWITYVILLGGVPALIIGIRWYSAYRVSKAAKARYIAPLDFKVLPQAGADSLLVGKIAETDVKSYISIPQLLMHSIAAGGTGSGKTVSAMVCSEELLKRKVPIIVFDPTAQWTGFMKPNTLKPMLDLYPRFGLKPTDATRFKVTVILVEDSDMPINIKDYMKPGEMTVFVMNRLPPEELDKFVRRSIQAIFDMRPPESKEIKLLVVYDEVHRLLPKYGGKKGYVAIERACREFRKWGIGIFLISQVLLDFKGAIRANIANEIQLRTKYEGDIGRVKSKYGSDYASKVTRLTIGTGLFQNPEFNHGRPWFLSFRPLLHSPFALTDKEVDTYMKLDKKVKDIEGKIAKLKAKKVDTYDIEVELNIARDKVKTANFRMAETYLESIEKRLEKMGVK